ncbi:creatininase [Mycolicibacterium pallens]|uniref:Creatininase n=2 Tax=Mycolicibacterium pallens TaxID=370524 RepID=A0ABX8VQL2_9MYCO|nr:creatininase [Mycolicibacterium pallens]
MSPVLGAGTVEYEWMTWPEIAAAAAADAPVVIAVGSTEQHGPHLPVSADWVIPQALLRLAAAKRPFVVGPSLRLGYRSRPASGGGQHFPGTLSLRATTFIAMIEDLLEELIRTGFRRIVLYSWHFENTNFVYEPAYLVSGRFPGVKIVVVENAMPEFDAADLEVLFPDGFPGLALEHAAVIETSLFEYLRPATVRMDRIIDDAPARNVPWDVLPIDPSMSTASGILASATQASVAKGELLTERIVDHIVSILDAEFEPIERTAMQLTADQRS